MTVRIRVELLPTASDSEIVKVLIPSARLKVLALGVPSEVYSTVRELSLVMEGTSEVMTI